MIFRLVSRYHVTLLVDEADNLGLHDPKSDIRGICNGGYQRSKSLIWRSVPPADGKGDWVPTPFDGWGAMSFAYIGELPRPLRSRCITLSLHPAPRGAKLSNGPNLRLKARHPAPPSGGLCGELHQPAPGGFAGEPAQPGSG